VSGRVLIVGAHPDDGVLGLGGTVVRQVKEGKEFFMCVVTSAYTPDWSAKYVRNQKKEVENSNKILGIKETRYLNFPAAKLDTIAHKVLNDTLLETINFYKPDTIFVPHKGDLHLDHRMVFESTLVAARPVNGGVRTILSFSTMESGFMVEPFLPNYYIDITETFDAKLAALKEFKSEVKQSPHPRSPEIVRALAQKWGSEAGVKFAEAFMLTRHIVR